MVYFVKCLSKSVLVTDTPPNTGERGTVGMLDNVWTGRNSDGGRLGLISCTPKEMEFGTELPEFIMSNDAIPPKKGSKKEYKSAIYYVDPK
tara:strand:- start:314 stop:586 length:273 start_codon:yes stop_codon:yes gene_type:complete